MNSIIVNPKDEEEFKLISEIFSKMKIQTHILSLDEKEDLLFSEMMKRVDMQKKVTNESIIKELIK